jgi:zinc transport system substrate-binding protein
MRVALRLVIAAIMLLVFSETGFAENKIPIFVSIVPQKYFVQQICKNLAQIQVMVQPGASPVAYEPKPKQMAELSKARIYFAIGVPFENFWMKKFITANPKMKVAHTDFGIEKLPMTGHHHHDEDSEPGQSSEQQGQVNHHELDDHDHAGLDPHIWLSPPLVKIQCQTILSAMQEIDPAHHDFYEANYLKFVSEIDQLDSQLRQTFAGRQGLQFIVFHPAWGYFAHAYGLEQVPIEIEGKDPKPAQLKELIDHARKKGIKVIFVQPQFSDKSARLVAKEIGGQVVFADPLAEDWMSNLMAVAIKFKTALK